MTITTGSASGPDRGEPIGALTAIEEDLHRAEADDQQNDAEVIDAGGYE